MSRRGLVVLVAAAAVAVALFVARSGVSGHHAKRPTVHTTTRPALDGAPPQIIAGADSDTRLALFETVTGKRLRSLTAWQPGGGVGGPDPAPDGKSIYASRGAGACASQIDRIAVDGSGEEPLVPYDERVGLQSSPWLNVDGTKMAYFTVTCDEAETSTLHVRDLRSGADVSFPLDPEESGGSVAWSPDGNQLAVAIARRDSSDGRVAILDVLTAHSITDARSLPGTCWTPSTAIAYLGDGRLVVACGTEGRFEVRTVAPSSGDTLQTLFTTGRTAGLQLDVSADGWFLYRIDSGVYVWHNGRRTHLRLDEHEVTEPAWMPRPASAPSDDEVRDVMRRTVEEDLDPATQVHFEPISGIDPVTVDDGAGGHLTAVIGVHVPTADAKGQLVFLWHNDTFVGWDADTETFSIVALEAIGRTSIRASYAEPERNRVRTATFLWKDHLRISGQPRPKSGTESVRVRLSAA